MFCIFRYADLNEPTYKPLLVEICNGFKYPYTYISCYIFRA